MRAMLAPIPMPSLMNKDDAKDTLRLVAKKLATRRAKRSALEAEAKAIEDARSMELGKKRAAKRAAIGSRPPKTQRVVDSTGRVRVI